MTTTFLINCTSRISKGMQLTGNILSGDTYEARGYIKEYWDGKWDSSRKAWIVNPEKVFDTIQNKVWGFTRVLSISELTTPKINKSNSTRGWCNKCQSYCFGDCNS